MKKIIFITSLLLVFTIVVFILTCIYGNPIKRWMVSREILNELEQKYNEQFELVESRYSFKFGTYGGIYQQAKKDGIKFSAERSSMGELLDYYPEETWARQVEIEILPKAKELFPNVYDQEVTLCLLYRQRDCERW